MPIHEGYDRKTKRNFFQYGTTGKKYYYNHLSEKSRADAYFRSLMQTRAIHSRKYKI